MTNNNTNNDNQSKSNETDNTSNEAPITDNSTLEATNTNDNLNTEANKRISSTSSIDDRIHVTYTNQVEEVKSSGDKDIETADADSPKTVITSGTVKGEQADPDLNTDTSNTDVSTDAKKVGNATTTATTTTPPPISNKVETDTKTKTGANHTKTIPPKTDVSLVCDNKKPKRIATQPKKSAMSKMYPIVLVLFLIGVFLMGMTYQTLNGRIAQPAQQFVVEEGQSYYGLLPQFQQDIPLFSNYLAKFYIKTYVDTPLHAGTYNLPENPTLPEFLIALRQSEEVPVVEVQIIEGKTAKDLYEVIASTPSIELTVLNDDGTPISNLKEALGIDATTPDGDYTDNLEGWFTPDTYHYVEGVTDKQILTDLYESQRKALDTAWAARDADLPYDTPYEALIMASIIEKETSVPEERALVSAVFVNRLNKGMRLQTDPTIIYGMGERYDGDIRRQDIDESTDYNTYQIDGLPPTPIALPSIASIEAAMHPADSEALYFVATGTGGHKFTNSLAEHNRAVQAYLRVIRQQ